MTRTKEKISDFDLSAAMARVLLDGGNVTPREALVRADLQDVSVSAMRAKKALDALRRRAVAVWEHQGAGLHRYKLSQVIRNRISEGQTRSDADGDELSYERLRSLEWYLSSPNIWIARGGLDLMCTTTGVFYERTDLGVAPEDHARLLESLRAELRASVADKLGTVCQGGDA